MSYWEKVKSIIGGTLTIICSLILIVDPEDSSVVIIAILGIGLLVYGLKILFYYFTMARYMVDGKMILYRGMVLSELGLFVNFMNVIPRIYIMIYLMAGFFLAGIVDVLRALEYKNYKVGAWKLKISRGFINIAVGIVCLIHWNSMKTMVYVCCAGWIYSAAVKIINSFKANTMIYIQ